MSSSLYCLSHSAHSALFSLVFFFFFFDDTATTEIYTLSLHDALPICFVLRYQSEEGVDGLPPGEGVFLPCSFWLADKDRKSTRLNSSHTVISYAVFCLKKKKKTIKSRLLDNRLSAR